MRPLKLAARCADPRPVTIQGPHGFLEVEGLNRCWTERTALSWSGAIGDAMGMPVVPPTERRSKKVTAIFTIFSSRRKTCRGLSRQSSGGGSTDDTMESVIISDILIADGGIHRDGVQSRHEKMGSRAENAGEHSDRTFHPEISDSSHRRQRPKETSGQGNTNGSAMRAAPIGVKYHYDLGKCMEAALASSLRESRQQTGCGAAACAVATAVAAGIAGGYSPGRGARCSVRCGGVQEEARSGSTAPSISKRIRMAEYIVRCRGTDIEYH